MYISFPLSSKIVFIYIYIFINVYIYIYIYIYCAQIYFYALSILMNLDVKLEIWSDPRNLGKVKIICLSLFSSIFTQSALENQMFARVLEQTISHPSYFIVHSQYNKQGFRVSNLGHDEITCIRSCAWLALDGPLSHFVIIYPLCYNTCCTFVMKKHSHFVINMV